MFMFICMYICVCTHIHSCHAMHMEVKGQLVRVGSLLVALVLGDGAQVPRFWGKYDYSLIHVNNPVIFN